MKELLDTILEDFKDQFKPLDREEAYRRGGGLSGIISRTIINILEQSLENLKYFHEYFAEEVSTLLLQHYEKDEIEKLVKTEEFKKVFDAKSLEFTWVYIDYLLAHIERVRDLEEDEQEE